MGEAKRKPTNRGPGELVRIGEDTITGMARRAYTEFRRLEMSTGARMKEWDDAPLVVRANWKDIIGRGLGNKGTLVNCNPTLTDPHTLLVTGLTDQQAEGIRMGLEAKLGGTAEKPAMNYSDKAFEAEPEGSRVGADGKTPETRALRDREAKDNLEHPEITPVNSDLGKLQAGAPSPEDGKR